MLIISKDWNHIKHVFWPQWYKTRNKKQGENWKIHKYYVNIKQHATEQAMVNKEMKKEIKISWDK